MPSLYADIALPLPLHHSFTYIVPEALEGAARPGCRVLAPFGKRTLVGVIVQMSRETSQHGLKPLSDILDAHPSFTSELLSLTQWVAEYYLAPWGEVLRAAAPLSLAAESKRMVRLSIADVLALLEKTRRTAPLQHAVLAALARKGTLSVTALQKETRIRHIHAVLRALEANEWIQTSEVPPERGPRIKTIRTVLLTSTGRQIAEGGANNESSKRTLTARQRNVLATLRQLLGERPNGIPLTELLRASASTLSIVQALARKELVMFQRQEVIRKPDEETVEPAKHIVLNMHQELALAEVSQALQKGEYNTFLLHGVTGSGKTQVYIEAIREVVAGGRTAIVLVPEISLTPQMVARFRSHFGEKVAVMHSQMSTGERSDAWRLAREGRVDIVIGPRSAVFAPLERLGLIVVDEEQESSYKQSDASPRYHARDVAVVRGTLTNSVVILGSATPSVESYFNATSGKYRLLELPERVDQARLPAVTIVDMAEERKRSLAETRARGSGQSPQRRWPPPTISQALYAAMERRIAAREGTILLQNRRGFSHLVECFECGYVERCDQCEVTMTYHSTKKHLRCHYCGRVKAPPSVCPSCGGIDLRFHAFGTQRIEEDLQRALTRGTILRMDLDTTTRRGSHERILQKFAQGSADILLGTQMVAKGLDFARVTLVGVISADTQMLLPDFRSAERTFQLLTQVAGRAGRSTKEGEVIIQTLQPHHYSLEYASAHDYKGFYTEELQYRKELDYPPFTRIALVELRGEAEGEVLQEARRFAQQLTTHANASIFTILGPTDAAFARLRGKFRKHIFIKSSKEKDPGGALMRSAVISAQQAFSRTKAAASKKVQLVIDVDPQGMM